MNTHLTELCDTLVARLRAEFGDGLLGVLATGSRIHGTPGPTSDLDVHVVIAAPRRQRRNIVLNGVEVELFINPPFQIRRYFADGRGVDQHMFAFGTIVYDPQGVVAHLQAEAREQWHRGPPAIAPSERWRYRYHPADLLRDLEDIAGDDATSHLLIATIVEQLLLTHYRLNGRWMPKAKRRLAELALWDAEAAQLARVALAGTSLSVQRVALDQLAAYVLAPLGGLMPLEWSTNWEAMQAVHSNNNNTDETTGNRT